MEKDNQYTLRNAMADLIDMLMPQFLRDNAEMLGDYARSEAFIVQLKAEALNRVPPQYITTLTGEVYSRYSLKRPQNSADLMVAISCAAADLLAEMEKREKSAPRA